jgi:cobalt-precorrin-6B (C15)-methyltransferase
MDRGNAMIKDSDFIKNPNVPGPTKEEIRCILLCKSEVSKEDVVVDIGCGTGGLTVEFAKKARKVYAIDLNPMATKTTQENVSKHQVEDKVEVIMADGLEALEDLGEFDVLIIGGSSGKLPQIIRKGYEKLRKNGKILVTSILLETATEAISTFKELSLKPEVVNIMISKGNPGPRGTMMFSNNPITVVSTKKL